MAGRTWFKQGVMGQLSPQAQKGFGRVARLYHDDGQDFFCTSLGEGTHSAGSLHYTGDAFDFQANKMRLVSIKKALGDDFDVVPSNSGAIHAEYDPKG
jgi:hypothetical protein